MRVAIAARLWRDTPFRQAAEDAQEAGYVGIEGISELFDEPTLARQVVRDAGLRVNAGFYPANWFAAEYRELELDQLRRVAEVFAGLDAEFLITASRRVPGRMQAAGQPLEDREDSLADYQWTSLTDSLALASLICARDFGLRLLFRNQLGSYIETQAELDQLMALTDPAILALAPDVGYLFYAGIDPVEFVRRNRERIAYVTLKDVDADLRERHLRTGGGLKDFALDGGFVELGQGDVDLPGVIDELRAAEYRGWVTVDQDRCARDPAASAQISREYLVGLGFDLEPA